jgi:hypothetical protein
MRSFSDGSATLTTPFSIASYIRFNFASASALRFRSSVMWPTPFVPLFPTLQKLIHQLRKSLRIKQPPL